MKNKKLKKRLKTYSNDIFLVSSLFNILLDVLQDGTNVKNSDKMTLAELIAKHLYDLKFRMVNIRSDLFGIE